MKYCLIEKICRNAYSAKMFFQATFGVHKNIPEATVIKQSYIYAKA